MLDKEPSDLQRSLERTNNTSILQLALGLPSPEIFPREELSELAATLLHHDAHALQYGPPEIELKRHIVELMRLRRVSCNEDEICITTGAQQALSLLAQLLLRHSGDSIMVEKAIYPGFRQAITVLAPTLVTIPSQGDCSIDTCTAERLLQKMLLPPAFLYSMSVGHNPLSTTMTERERSALVNFALRHNIPIVEDDVYGFLQYDGESSPPLRALGGNSVFYVGSFSKIIAPALRVGWIVAPKSCVKTLNFLKEGSDINTSTLAQRIVCRYLDRCTFSTRVDCLRDHYRKRRDLMNRALTRYFPTGMRWRVPAAGFFFWTEFESGADTRVLLEQALLRDVAFVPGIAFATTDSSDCRSAMRLSFSNCAVELIDEAIARIAAATRATCQSRDFVAHA